MHCETKIPAVIQFTVRASKPAVQDSDLAVTFFLLAAAEHSAAYLESKGYTVAPIHVSACLSHVSEFVS